MSKAQEVLDLCDEAKKIKMSYEATFPEGSEASKSELERAIKKMKLDVKVKEYKSNDISGGETFIGVKVEGTEEDITKILLSKDRVFGTNFSKGELKDVIRFGKR